MYFRVLLNIWEHKQQNIFKISEAEVLIMLNYLFMVFYH